MKRMIWFLSALFVALLVATVAPGQLTEASPADEMRPTLTPTPVVSELPTEVPTEVPTEAPAAPPSAVSAEIPSPVFGRVLFAETSTPVQDARVTFRIGGNQAWHTTSDALGAFAFPDAGEGWGYVDVALPEGLNAQSLTGPILIQAQRSEPVELVWGVTGERQSPPIKPVIRAAGPIRTGSPMTATIEVNNTTTFKASRSQLTVKAPEGTDIVGAQSDHGPVAVQGDQLAFRLGDIMPGEKITLKVALQARGDASAGYHDLAAWLVYGEFVAAETRLNMTVDGNSFLPQTGLREVLLGILQAGVLVTLIVLLARHRLRPARQQ